MAPPNNPLGNPISVGNHSYVFKHKAIVGTDYCFTCAECDKEVNVTFLESGARKIKCNSCGALYAAMVKEPENQTNDKGKEEENKVLHSTTTDGNNDEIRYKSGAALVHGCLLHRQIEPLYYGKNIVGRDDKESQSDINLTDSYISRRSVEIRVSRKPGGTGNSFRLTVLHTSNPIYVNSIQLKNNQQVYLNYNDKLKMGNTVLTLKKVDKNK